MSPVQMPERSKEGFTLVEVLIALLVAMSLVGAAAPALVGVLKAEETSLSMQEVSLHVQSATCSKLLQHEADAMADIMGEDWSVTQTLLEPTMKMTNTWDVWVILPRAGSGPAVELYFVAD